MAGPASTRRHAIVTGASRGIGKATAIALAEAGYDVVITGRTLKRGDGAPEPSGRITDRLPGSLEETAEAMAAAGGTAHPVALDLGDAGRLAGAAHEALDALDGGVDLLVNNAIWTGPGNDTRFLDTQLDDIEARIFGNITAQLRFMQPVVAAMVASGRGVVANMTSGAADAPPFALPGEGGWGLAYTVAKAGFHRIAVQLAFEYADAGLRAFNLQPGFVATERVRLLQGPVRNVARQGVSPAVIGATIAHVAVHAAAFESGSTIELQELARELGLLPTSGD